MTVVQGNQPSTITDMADIITIKELEMVYKLKNVKLSKHYKFSREII